jgi:hypothetical protein
MSDCFSPAPPISLDSIQDFATCRLIFALHPSLECRWRNGAKSAMTNWPSIELLLGTHLYKNEPESYKLPA